MKFCTDILEGLFNKCGRNQRKQSTDTGFTGNTLRIGVRKTDTPSMPCSTTKNVNWLTPRQNFREETLKSPFVHSRHQYVSEYLRIFCFLPFREVFSVRHPPDSSTWLHAEKMTSSPNLPLIVQCTVQVQVATRLIFSC